MTSRIQRTGYSTFLARLGLLKTLGRRTIKAIESYLLSPRQPQSGYTLIRPSSTNGMGVLAELMERCLRETGEPLQVLFFDEHTDATESAVTNETVIVALTPGHIPFARFRFIGGFRRNRRRIALFIWDVDVIPLRLRISLWGFDEVWATSTMGVDYLQKTLKTPVRYFPTPILPNSPSSSDYFRTKFGLQGKFVFSYQFDAGSGLQRKNPAGAIDMYLTAFPESRDQTHLFLKCTGADETGDAWLDLRDKVAGRSDITLVNEFWTDDEVDSMYSSIDCYLSPHRSEGYGLTVARAIAQGVYVVATPYGGPSDFMMRGNCGFIEFEMSAVGDNSLYPSHALWAEPSIESGARLLAEAFRNRDALKMRAAEARDWALDTFSLNRSVDFLRNSAAHR